MSTTFRELRPFSTIVDKHRLSIHELTYSYCMLTPDLFQPNKHMGQWCQMVAMSTTGTESCIPDVSHAVQFITSATHIHTPQLTSMHTGQLSLDIPALHVWLSREATAIHSPQLWQWKNFSFPPTLKHNQSLMNNTLHPHTHPPYITTSYYAHSFSLV